MRGKESRFFVLDLRIKAPSLNNYTYTVLHVRHGIAIYLVKIDACDGKDRECQDEKEFIAALEEIFSLTEVEKVIVGLLTQIQADKMQSMSTYNVTN